MPNITEEFEYISKDTFFSFLFSTPVLSAAFETIDHDVIINLLEKPGNSDCVLNRFNADKGENSLSDLDHLSEKHDFWFEFA